MRAGNFDPMVCNGCGHIETEVERELDKDCLCGGNFIERPYVFHKKTAVKSSTSVLTNAPGKIVCQMCGCRDKKHAGCQCKCHERD